MSRIAKEQVFDLARAAGLKLDDTRAEMIASRLSGVLDGIDNISDEDLEGVEPLPVFVAGSFDKLTMSGEAQNG